MCLGRALGVAAVRLRLVALGQAEVEDLHPPVGGEEQVLGLEVAVDDALGVRGGEAASHLGRDLERLARR